MTPLNCQKTCQQNTASWLQPDPCMSHDKCPAQGHTEFEQVLSYNAMATVTFHMFKLQPQKASVVKESGMSGLWPKPRFLPTFEATVCFKLGKKRTFRPKEARPTLVVLFCLTMAKTCCFCSSKKQNIGRKRGLRLFFTNMALFMSTSW